MLGKFIRVRRTELGVSLRVAAQQMEIDPAYLSRVEAGKVPPSEHLLRKLAGFLSVSEDELLLLAGRLPESLRTAINREPYRVTAALRSMGEMIVAEPGTPYGKLLFAEQGTRAIEDGFPFEEISEIAEVESWRKEIYRPIYHIHKWWAQRLGTVFRATILGAIAPKGSSIMDLFYQPVQLPGVIVFDPFMGSGTTVGEAQKLGCTVIGRDINPVAFRTVRTALGPLNRYEVEQHFRQLEGSVGADIRNLYRSKDSNGAPCDVLYFFWVKVLPCPECGESVDLFSSYVFARHSYPKRHPTVHAICPECGHIVVSKYDAQRVRCTNCKHQFDQYKGPAKRSTAVCQACGHEFPIAKIARSAGAPPKHRMYAKLVLRADGVKEYLPITDEDRSAFGEARERLERLNPPLPRVPIAKGFNTRQILNYGYCYWHEAFNERQLLALSSLAEAIRDLPHGSARDALMVLFSGVLEFNNMFASYKGEGTGAVRHMFSHHILKPERAPIEANPWGTTKSSGAFSTLFRSRLLRALDYRDAPFEVAVEYLGKRKKGRKVVGVSPPMGGEILTSYPSERLAPGATYLSCGNSADTDIPDQSVDLVITDPPFFDNVHYSELADFFYVWQETYFGGAVGKKKCTTRHEAEVQDTDALAFANKLRMVFEECHRVLRNDGLMVFSYHHSREDGWSSVAQAVLGAGFSLVQSQPVKSEMSVAAPKNQAKEPIDLDVLLVCRKRCNDRRQQQGTQEVLRVASQLALQKVQQFNRVGRRLSRNDVRVVLLSQLLVELCAGRTTSETVTDLEKILPQSRTLVEQLWQAQELHELEEPLAKGPGPVQLQLLLHPPS